MNTWFFFFLLAILWLLACNNELQTSEAANNKTPAVAKKVSDTEPSLFRADSLQVLYYDDPDGDSLRYTRYFTLTETGDTANINTLLDQMDQVYVQEPSASPCRSEGKLYLLKGEEILKTVYFSTRGNNCSYFYFIKDGVFVYLPMTRAAATWLKENKQKARKPA